MCRTALSVAILIISLSSVSAQQLGRPQDGFYSGQWSGQVDERVDIADGKQAALTTLFRELGPLDGRVGHSGDVAPTEAGLCQLIERLYAERDHLGEPAFTAANRLVRDTLRKLLDQDLTVAGKAEA